MQRSKLPLVGIILLFAIPWLLAILLYGFHDQISFKPIQSGQLMTPPIPIKTLDIGSVQPLGKWQLIYLAPKQCDASCLKRTDMLKRIQCALGKDQHRVLAYSIPYTEKLSKYEWENCVLILDPQGFVMMLYPSTPLNAKSVLKDLHRLLRFSHVG